VNAVHGTGVHTRRVFSANTRFSYYVGHMIRFSFPVG
jgi:hypothetical protein